MTETKNPGEKKLSVGGGKTTLTLKPRTETGVVRQSFSHGRTKQVVVEKVKRRVIAGETAKLEPAPAEETARKRATAPAKVAPAARAAPSAPAVAPAKP